MTYRDVVIELQRLLEAGASPGELSEILRRREFIEPLPVDARKEVLGLLDAATEPTAAAAGDQQAESAGAGSIPTPESKLITVPVQTRKLPDDAPGNVIVRAITLARASALADSVRRKHGRMAPATKSAPPRRTAPQSTPIPAEESVTDGNAAPVDSHESDNWSDLAAVWQELTLAPVAESSAPKVRGVAPRRSMARVIGWSAVVLAVAAAAWLYTRLAPLRTKPVVPAADTPLAGTNEGTTDRGAVAFAADYHAENQLASQRAPAPARRPRYSNAAPETQSH